MKQALLLVDLQNDFFPGGTLGVGGANEIVPHINTLLKECVDLPVVVSRDWHPKDTCHFIEHGGSWPAHCVQDTEGAAFHKDVNIDLSSDRFFLCTKGTDPKNDGGYSAFEGLSESGQALEDTLKSLGVEQLVVMGLATDYCVKHSVLDALKRGFKVKLLLGAVRAVNVRPTDGEEALKEMELAGADLIQPGWRP